MVEVNLIILNRCQVYNYVKYCSTLEIRPEILKASVELSAIPLEL